MEHAGDINGKETTSIMNAITTRMINELSEASEVGYTMLTSIDAPPNRLLKLMQCYALVIADLVKGIKGADPMPQSKA